MFQQKQSGFSGGWLLKKSLLVTDDVIQDITIQTSHYVLFPRQHVLVLVGIGIANKEFENIGITDLILD